MADELKLLLQYFQLGENETLLKKLIAEEFEALPDEEDERNPETKEKLNALFQMLKRKL
jgi:hypothetical protein